jgi:hypothetical protein
VTNAEIRAINRVIKAAQAYVKFERLMIARGQFTDFLDPPQRALHEAVDKLEKASATKRKQEEWEP